MPLFVYDALDKQGKRIKGELASDSEQNALTSLKMQSLFPIKIAESKERKESLNRDILKKKVKKKHVAIFARQFASMLRAGIPLSIILTVLIKQEKNKTFKETLETINSDIMKGSTLSAAMSKYKFFPSFMISMVEVGEANGRLDVAFDRVAVNMDREIKLTSKIKGAMIYPSVLLTVTIAASIILTLVVIPKFSQMFAQAGAELPLLTKSFVAVSGFLKSYWFIPILAVVLIAIAFSALLKNKETKRKFDRLIFYLPVIGKLQNVILMARFCRTFSSLVDAGVDVIISLETVKNVINNEFIKKCFDEIIADVKGGANISNAIEKYNMFTPLVVSMTKIGEESGQLGEILTNTAELYEDESEIQLQRVTALVEPAITIIMAIMVGTIVISIVQPMFQLYNLVGQ